MIDGGFRLSDGHALAKAIVATGKRLTTIYISQSDPDYYFGLAPVLEAFPDAVVVAAPETVMAIAANVDQKLAVWGPQLKDNGPQQREDLVFAQPWGRLHSCTMAIALTSCQRMAWTTAAICGCHRCKPLWAVCWCSMVCMYGWLTPSRPRSTMPGARTCRPCCA